MKPPKTPQPRPGVRSIRPYVPGSSKRKGRGRVIKLASNENPYGPSPKVAAALKRAIENPARYPEGSSAALREAIANAYNIDAARIVCGAGSEQLIAYLAQAYAGPGDEVVQSEYSFLVYRLAAAAAGAGVVNAKEKGYRTDVDAVLGAVSPKTKIVFLANPNNPTGTWIPAREVRRLWQHLPSNVLLVLDTAYAEYVGDEDYDGGLALVEEAVAAGRENVAVLRTFSKIYGLAGLRLGWCYGPEGVADALNRVRGAFNVSSIAQAAGIAAIEDQGFVKKMRDANARGLAFVKTALEGMNLEVLPSAGNFVLARFPGGEAETARVYDFLKNHGIILRPVGAYGLADFLRITIGTDDENRALVKALENYFREQR